jgi:uncharacterized protein YxeA
MKTEKANTILIIIIIILLLAICGLSAYYHLAIDNRGFRIQQELLL